MDVMMRRRELMGMQKGGKSPLPFEYQRVEYVENPDTAYIMTDFDSSQVLRVDMDFYYVQARTWCNLFGASDSTADPNGNALLLSNSGYTSLNVYPKVRIPVNLLQAGSRYNLSSVFTSGEQKLTVNGQILGTGSTLWETAVPHMSIFGMYYGTQTNKPLERALVRIYSCQFYSSENGTIIEDFIPCYRKSDGEIGMYGSITKTFYTNAGTGTFLKGQDI